MVILLLIIFYEKEKPQKSKSKEDPLKNRLSLSQISQILPTHPPAWVFAAAKLFLVGISNKVLNKLKKKTKEG